MTEDEQYRSSTQFRLWSFTPEALASLRRNTNAVAAERVRAAFKRIRDGRVPAAGSDVGDDQGERDGELQKNREVECLTVEEEQKLIGFYCEKCKELGQFFNFPINVIATAIQFLHRFYLSNSPMTYHPKQIMPSALFLATKTENNHIFLKDFAAKIPRATPEGVLAPEFIITQGLRFTFDVRHPHRGLRGGYLELLSMARGTAAPPPGSPLTATDLRRGLATLADDEGVSPRASERPQADVIRRLETAYGRVSETLKTAAILSDAYFLYTPAQIWLGALRLADAPLCAFYLETKFPTPPTNGRADTENVGQGRRPAKEKVLAAIAACATLLRQATAAGGVAGTAKEELVRIDKKLYQCRNPEKVDLVGLNRAVKRDGAVEGRLDESVAKRRKLEREKSAREEDIFGGDLKRA